MQLRVKSFEELGAGAMFVGIGLFAVYLSWDYPMGETLNMGPGYFPRLLGGILVGFGLIISAQSLRVQAEDGEQTPWAIRPWLVLPAALVLFATMLSYGLGFVPSVMALVVASSFAHKDMRPLETAALTVAVTLGCVAVFIWGLGLPYRLFWWSY